MHQHIYNIFITYLQSHASTNDYVWLDYGFTIDLLLDYNGFIDFMIKILLCLRYDFNNMLDGIVIGCAYDLIRIYFDFTQMLV